MDHEELSNKHVALCVVPVDYHWHRKEVSDSPIVHVSQWRADAAVCFRYIADQADTVRIKEFGVLNDGDKIPVGATYIGTTMVNYRGRVTVRHLFSREV